MRFLGIVENMAYYEEQDGSKNYLFGKGGGEDTCRTIANKVIAKNTFCET